MNSSFSERVTTPTWLGRAVSRFYCNPFFFYYLLLFIIIFFYGLVLYKHLAEGKRSKKNKPSYFKIKKAFYFYYSNNLHHLKKHFKRNFVFYPVSTNRLLLTTVRLRFISLEFKIKPVCLTGNFLEKQNGFADLHLKLFICHIYDIRLKSLLFLFFQEETEGPSFMAVSGPKTSLYESMRHTGAASLLENLQSQLKLKEGEISQLQVRRG
jgi:hypothetical protein